MNRYNFKKNVLAVSLLYLTALIVALISSARGYPSYDFIRDLKEYYRDSCSLACLLLPAPTSIFK